jgi:hypothetical protein
MFYMFVCVFLVIIQTVNVTAIFAFGDGRLWSFWEPESPQI